MSMPPSDPFSAHIQEQLAPLGRITVRRMFGAQGVFLDGLMFAIIAGETLFLKADDETRADFQAEGLSQISYDKSDGTTILMAYWQAPDRLLDDDDEMIAWARKAILVARRAQKPARKSKTRGERKPSQAARRKAK